MHRVSQTQGLLTLHITLRPKVTLSSVTEFLSNAPHLGLAAIVFLGFLEACPGIGLFISGILLFGIASFLYVESLFSIAQIVPCAMLGGFLADQLGFALGWWFGPGVKRWSIFRRHQDRMAAAEVQIVKFGPWAAVIGRFLTMIRSLVPMILGMAGVSWRRYVVWDLAAVSVWGIGFVLLLGGIERVFD